MNSDIDAHSEVDLLIAGAGPAGMTTALVASLEGLDVLLCEKSDQVGGTGSTSAGTLWIPGNSQSRAAGFDDSAEQADRYLDALIGEATKLAHRLAAGPTLSYAAIKQAINAAATNTLDQQLDLERDSQRALGRSADFKEGVAAFLAKRPANFAGR